MDTLLPSPNDLVTVRQRGWIVESIVPGSSPGECAEVLLSCIDDDNAGAQLQVYWERELDAKILANHDFSSAERKGFDDPRVFASYLNTLRWNCVTATDPNLFQAPFRAGIKIEAYQLEPLRRALHMPRVNLFIADDVGVGKTIEAGLVVRELMLRKKANFVLVAAPASMVGQWQQEMESRFGLEFQVFDREFMQKMRIERGHAINPWKTHSRFIISHKLLIDSDYVNPLTAMLGEYESRAVLVLDEAHHAAPASGSKYAVDTQITRAIRELAPRFEHRLFLSATPHNGHSNSFSALLEILDKNRFTRGEKKIDTKAVREVIIRRLKSDIRAIEGGFPERVIKRIDLIDANNDAPEIRLAILLNEYRQARTERLKNEPKSEQRKSSLVMTGLYQRLLSSVFAFNKTFSRHARGARQTAEAVRTIAATDLQVVFSPRTTDDEYAQADEQAMESAENENIPEASRTSSSPSRRELELIQEISRIASREGAQADFKIKYLTKWIKENMCPDLGSPSARWTDVRVIIFTEWDDTKNYILAQLQNAIKDPVSAAERLACFHGATSKDQREAIKMAFNASPEADPLRILVATDAAREGLNLQSRCHNLFHFDIPWNPSRMEQRNGRIDRKLQPSPQVFCHYFYYPNRPQDPLLDKIIQKSEVIRRELGSQSQVIDDEIKARIEAGDSLEGAVSVFEARIEDAKKAQKIAMDELECSREVQADLRKRLIELEDVKRKSELHIDINEDRFLRALNSSLDIQRLSKIQPLDATGKRFAFPRLDKDQGASANWFFALDSLRRPKLADESFQEWRRNSPIRPITFTDPGVLDDSLLHMHLGHRLAQRLLGRFVAQGFTADDLSRTCLLPAPDGIPRVALLASVRLFGAGGARLHEEIITVTARWTPIKDRKIALEPYSRDSEKKTMDMIGKLLDDSSAFFKLDAPTEVLSAIGRDARELLVHLGPRAEDASVSAMAALANRGKKELSAMEQHLEERRRRIKETLGSHEQDNSYFVRAFANPIERRQLELNIKHWQKRLAEIDVEIKTEPSKIAAGYEVRARRIEPIGLIYLWPFAKASRGKTS